MKILISRMICNLKVLLVLVFCCSISFSQTTNCKLLYAEDGVESAYPRLSRDKKTILFQTNRSGKWQLLYMDLESRNQTSVNKDTFNNNFPDWSADNQWITFVSDRDGNEEIYLMKNDGSDMQRLTYDPGRDIHPYFSPDGNYILFSSTRGNKSLDIYRYTIKTKKTERLTNSLDNETCARYSPNMQLIVYLKNNNVSDDIYVLNIFNFLSDNITKTPTVQDGWPIFSADGKWIYYSSKESGKYSIFRIQPDGNNKQRLTFAKDGEEDARVCISDDGSMMIYNKKTGKTIDLRVCLVLY